MTLPTTNGSVSGVENGRAYDAYCIECNARVEHKFGAWICPTHRDRGHVRFEERPMPQTAQSSTYGFDTLAADIHAWARGKGFYDRERLRVVDPVTGDVEGRPVNPSLPAEKLMLIVSEAAEALEALRDDDRENEAEEVADIVIRVLDYAAWRGISLDREIAAKMDKNQVRPRLHGRAAF